MLALELLKSDINLFNSLSNKQDFILYRNISYSKYNGLLESFQHLNLCAKSFDLMVSLIQTGIKNEQSIDVLIRMFGQKYQIIIRYIYDHLTENHILETDDTDNLIETELPRQFKWRHPQEKAWTMAIDTDFSSGIFSIATGVGKSLIILKIIWEYNKRYPKHSVLLFCDRQEILRSLFYKKSHAGIPGLKQEAIMFWRENDIIDMEHFHIMEFVYDKTTNWVNSINNYTGDKPLFIIINRQRLTTYSDEVSPGIFKYEDIHHNQPRFIILDECHSGLADRTYEFLTFAKNSWKSKIQGFSATPYRSGKHLTNLKLEHNNEMNHDTNLDRIFNLFHKPNDLMSLNILYSYNLKDAIEDGYVLEPVFNWFQIDDYKKKKNNSIQFTDTEIASVLGVLDNILSKCYYKKCIVWCREIKVADEWHQLFENYKGKYDNLRSVPGYKSHSKCKSQSEKIVYNYEEYYPKKDGILFCACQYREGSDIPYLSCELLLDKALNRGDVASIQYFGRVLRLDSAGKKNKGHIIDGCIFDDNQYKIKNIIDKIIKYYINLYNIDINANKYTINKHKIEQYNIIMSSLHIEPNKKEIYIEMNNNKKVSINMANLKINSVEWNDIIPHFSQLLQKEFNMTDHEEFIIFRDKVQKYGIKNNVEYNEKYKELDFSRIDQQGKKEYVIDPSRTYQKYFVNWYHFLGINTDMFIKDKYEWRQKCLDEGLSADNYFECIQDYPDLPDMPGQFYKDFTNLYAELNNDNIIFNHLDIISGI